MYVTLGVGVGGLNFDDRSFDNKPWKNRERLSQKKFYDAKNEWSSTWKESSSLEVDYIKVSAV